MSIQIGTVTLTRNPSYDSDFHKNIYNQAAVKTLDLVTRVYDHGTNTPQELIGILVFIGVLRAEAESLLTYIIETAKYEKNTFNIIPPLNTDIGAGIGVTLGNCIWNGGQTTKGYFTFIAPGKYNIKFPYRRKV